jgi:DNA-3-methyladenine glycosylase
MHIDRRQNAVDLLSDELHIRDTGAHRALSIVRRPRIGVDYAGQWARRLLRFYIKGNEYVSKK